MSLCIAVAPPESMSLLDGVSDGESPYRAGLSPPLVSLLWSRVVESRNSAFSKGIQCRPPERWGYDSCIGHYDDDLTGWPADGRVKYPLFIINNGIGPGRTSF